MIFLMKSIVRSIKERIGRHNNNKYQENIC